MSLPSPRPPLLSFLQTRDLTAAARGGQPAPRTPRTPPPRPLPSLRPNAAETLRGKLRKPKGGRRMTWPARLPAPSPNRVTWRPQRGAQCIPPGRPKTQSPRAVGDETCPARYRRGHGWEQGGIWYPGSPVLLQEGGDGGGRGEGASTWGTCRRAHGHSAAFPPSPSSARPRSCAVGLTVPGAVPVLGPGAGET